jgi:hypothetical protein
MWNVLWMVCCYYYNNINNNNYNNVNVCSAYVFSFYCVSVCFFLLVRLRPPFILSPLSPSNSVADVCANSGVGEFTTKQYPINGYSYNSAIVYISICPVANVFVCFVCVVLY